MKHFSYIQKTLSFVPLLALLACSLTVATPTIANAAPAAKANSGAGLCHDSFSGVTYACPESASEKVDGTPKGKFDKTKCYIFGDPNKGWVVLPCNNSVFTDVTIIPNAATKTDEAIANDCPKELESSDGGCDLIKRYANPLITFLTVAVGLVVTISIVIGGIQYASARNNPQAISAAKTRITNALLGFLAYSLLWGFLQWIVPGGFLNG